MDAPWLPPIDGAKHPLAVVLEPKGEWLDLYLSDLGCDGGWRALNFVRLMA